MGGAGAIIWINDEEYYMLMMNYGQGTNTRLEMMALWIILFFSKSKGILLSRVFGDSKFIIDWVNNKNDIQVLQLIPWMDKIRGLICNCQVFISHMFIVNLIERQTHYLNRCWPFRKDIVLSDAPICKTFYALRNIMLHFMLKFVINDQVGSRII